ncbi:MAG: sporulation protein Cse60 [Bacteroidales bacterium]|jgi:hypothetical protein|nr:sporulation protein Cse60 [Bacteroidales bacterium]
MKVLTKHFQYSGLDDFDLALDAQINDFLTKANIGDEELIDIKYHGYSEGGNVITYSALVIYKSKK